MSASLFSCQLAVSRDWYSQASETYVAITQCPGSRHMHEDASMKLITCNMQSQLQCHALPRHRLFAGKLKQLYRAAMQMEVVFFSSQPGTASPPKLTMLVVDFDDTCTSTDTISQIFNTAIAATQRKAPGRCMAAFCFGLSSSQCHHH